MEITWLDNSDDEYRYAKNFCDKLDSFFEPSILLYQNIIESLYNYFINDTSLDLVTNSCLPQYDGAIDFSLPYSTNGNSISTNILSILAYEFSSKVSLSDNKGVIFTPFILAKDMVRISLLHFITEKEPTYSQQIKNALLGKIELDTYIKEIIRSLVWLDPCIGSGVFCLAIIQMYQELNISSSPIIFGYDLNPLFATTSQLRCNLLAQSIWGTSNSITIQEKNFFSISHRKKFDIIVGNPPYVKSADIDVYTRTIISSSVKSLKGKNNDLYAYFIVKCLGLLKRNGVMTFITPAQFHKSINGLELRNIINQESTLLSIFDFNELKVFKNASVHTAVFSLLKSIKKKNFHSYNFSTLPKRNPLLFGLENSSILSSDNISSSGWHTKNNNALTILNKMEKNATSLVDLYGKVYSGIRLHHKTAYLLSPNKTDELRTNENANYIVPIVIAKQIRTWNYTQTYNFLLLKQGIKLSDSDPILEHLNPYIDVLKKRSKSSTSWYNLRSCSYYEKFLEPKIVFPDIATEPRFAMDTANLYLADGAYFFPCSDYYILGLLNSSLSHFYFREKCASIGNPEEGGRLRFKKIYVEAFPVKYGNNAQNEAVSNLAQKASISGLSESEIKKLNRLVCDIYDIDYSLLEGKLNI